MLKVNIEDLTFDCIIGILDFEREKEQKVILDISFEYFFNDNGSNYIDYSEIVFFVEDTMKKEQFKLIEDAILFIRKKLKTKYDIENLKIKISKPDIMLNCVVSVEE
ncbi:MAG TPA: dihydroneopterin aldolase [Arcobacter sp.]|nr:dihydroneopterin aldolase [Arcobacter sp.]